MSAKSPTRQRLQLEFTESNWKEFEELKASLPEPLCSGPNADVVRSALALYRWYREQQAAGKKLALIDPETEKVSDVELVGI